MSTPYRFFRLLFSQCCADSADLVPRSDTPGDRVPRHQRSLKSRLPLYRCHPEQQEPWSSFLSSYSLPVTYSVRRCPPRAQPSSPLADLRTVLFHSPRRSLPVPVLPSPPESSLIVSSHPTTVYYRAARHVVSRVLASLVTDPCASPSSVSALTATVADFAFTRRLDYATRVVAAPPPILCQSGGYFFSLGAGAVSWRSTQSSSVASSSAEAEIYTGAMAAQDLRWLTFLLTDLGERPCSAPTLYADNKAMILLCREP
ncbi:unnamed protein product [Closterium sp. NIES-53]